MLIAMSDLREEQRVWLRRVLEQTGWSMNALAKKAKVSTPTISVFLNDETKSHNLTARTIAAIERASGMRYGPDPRPAGMRESEAEPFDRRQSNAYLDPWSAIGGANGVDPWTLRSRALEVAGYLPGDVLLVDLSAEPKPGDVVCAQVYDWARSTAQTVFRLWEPPYLQVATLDPTLRKIFVVDNSNVVIKGVVVSSIRGRQARAA